MTLTRRASRIALACLIAVALMEVPGLQVQVAAVNAQYVFTTLASVSSIGSADGTGANARFNLPRSVTADSAGNVFVADWLNGTIRKVTPAGVVTTFAGVAGTNQVAQDGTGSNARFARPIAITTGPGDVLYVIDNHAIRTITPGAVVTTLAGDANTAGSIDNTGTAARFHSPLGLDLDSAGNVIVADTTNCLIRKVTPGGVVTTILGVLFACTYVDGSAAVARFQIPYGLAIDSQDNIYVSEFSAGKIRKITPALDVSTFAAAFATPTGLTTDGTNLYLADQDNQLIWKITSGAAVSAIAGLAFTPGSVDGTGSAARFRSPTGVALDVSGNLFVADAGNNAIRKITSAAVVTTLAGRPNIGSADGFPTVARFNTPRGIAVDVDGNAYVADTGNHTIRKIAPGGTVSTLAGLAGVPGSTDGLGSGARFSSPNDLVVDHDGNVYVADTGNSKIRKITPGGLVTTLAGSGAFTNVDGVGTTASFGNLSGITLDGNGNLFVCDIYFNTIRKIAPPNIVTTFAGVAGVPGSTDGTAEARFNQPNGVAADGGNNIWVSDSNTNIIRRISPAGVVSTMAGLAGQFGNNDGLGPAARFTTPQAIAADTAGNAYVFSNNVIRKITPVGLTSTIAGTNGPVGLGSGDGPATSVQFRFPEGIAIDSALSLYVADTGNHTIRKGDLPTGLVSVSPTSLKFGAVKNGVAGDLTVVPPPQDVTVSFVAPAGVWNASTSTPWLQITNATGNGAGAFTVGIINPGNVIGGGFTLAGTVTLDAPTASNSPIVINVTLNINWTSNTPVVPIGQVDAPAFNALGVQGAIGVSGWALDNVGVASVKIWRNCLAPDEPVSNCIFGLLSGSPSTGLVYIGDAAFVAGARPDLESALPQYPQNYRAGWGYLLLTTMLPRTAGGPFAPYGGQGPITLYAIATDLEANVTVLGRVWNIDHNPTPITMNNDAIAKPFGAIDTPTQGGTVSSVIGNFGWVLTPDLNNVQDGTDILMPTNGSTLFVYLDGLPVANVTYNQCRGNVGNPPAGGVYCNDDVASIFGNAVQQPPLTERLSNPTRYRNLDAGRGPQGSWALDTTLLANGLHSIAWSATDSNGRVEGIGSRNFVVLNTGGARPVSDAEFESLLAQPAQSRGRAATLDGLRVSKRPVSMRTGFDPRTVMKEIERTRDFVRTVSVAPMDRVELGFASALDGGYLVANGELRDLPVGSSLDRKTGVFAWAPPLGYLGTYRLVFVVGNERVLVDVTVANDDAARVSKNNRRPGM